MNGQDMHREDVEAETRRRFAEQMRHTAEQGEKLTGGAGVPDERSQHDRRGGQQQQASGDEFNDWPEVWGPRVGRALGYAFALYLLWHLFSTYVLQ